MENEVLIVGSLIAVLGVILRILYPFGLAKLRDSSVSFELHYIVGQIIAGVIAVAGVAGFSDQIQNILDIVGGNIGLATYALLFLYGWGAASVGREAQKTPGAIQARRNGSG